MEDKQSRRRGSAEEPGEGKKKYLRLKWSELCCMHLWVCQNEPHHYNYNAVLLKPKNKGKHFNKKIFLILITKGLVSSICVKKIV